MFQSLNPLDIPLEGIRLIEASAGTGKTYNIAALFVRLVVLERMDVEQILVVTFTTAATAELKNRLRARLNEILSLLNNPSALDNADSLLRDIIAAAERQESRDLLRLRLQAALNSFDRASVYTIHGFCQRVLSDYAFWCQSPFDMDTAEPDPKQLACFAEDFWRRRVSREQALSDLVCRKKLSPQTVVSVWQHNLQGGMTVRTCAPVDLAATEAALQHAADGLLYRLAQVEAEFWRIHPKLNGNKYRRPTFEKLFADLHGNAASGSLDTVSVPNMLPALIRCLNSELKQNIKKNQEISEQEWHALQPLCGFAEAALAWSAADQSAAVRVQTDALEALDTQLAEHKRNSRQRSFDDLVGDVGAALAPHNPHAAALAEAMAQKWRIALIDECQDTDPVQYRIFKTAFAGQGRPLLMVGDPKQAIYRFRGADIHAYLQAAADTPVTHRYTLSVNRRTHAALLDAVGSLFLRKARPFALDGIDYTPVSAFRRDGALQPPQPAMTVRWLHDDSDMDEEGNEILPSKETLRRRAAEWCADEIAAALAAAHSGSLKLADADCVRPLHAGEIAVLVRTHQEGLLIAQTLKKRGVSSVSLGHRSVFAGEEAEALSALLHFWLQPQQIHLLRFVLGGVLFAQNAQDLAALNQNETAINLWLERAQDAHECWQQRGVFCALTRFSSATGLETGLLRRRNERALTNFRQLAELLSDAETDLPTPAALVQWLDGNIARARDPENATGENAQLRLESDENLVKIVTMHASKGLEYPLVYCPFAWDGKDPQKTEWHMLHGSGGNELVHASLLRDGDESAILNEHMGEMLRLYYVAFTRARERLVVYAAASSHVQHNPVAYLLTPGRDTGVAAHYDFWADSKKSRTDTLRQLWRQHIANAAQDGITIDWQSGAPPAAAAPEDDTANASYRALTLPERTWRTLYHTSFTALSQHTAAERETDDEDMRPSLDSGEFQAAAPDAEAEPQTPLLRFARGITAGLCLHAALEASELSAPAQGQKNLYPPILAHYGFDDADGAADMLAEMVDAVRAAALSDRCLLGDIGADKRVAEMDFLLRVEDFALPQLRRWLAQPHIGLPENCVQAARLLDFATVSGYLNGAIDLVCEDDDGGVYVIDYKSNHLGNTFAHYAPAAMNEAMAEHHYYLQALIYSIAVARYLQTFDRLPETISVRYLFVRGLNADNDNGVWRWDIATADLKPWLEAHDNA